MANGSELALQVFRRSAEVWGPNRATNIVGCDPGFVTALERAGRLARAGSSLLITGETGTGKELFARAIYLLSERAGRPYLSINCAQYRDTQLIASELFGHKRGSFTGALADHRGLFEEADGGVLFLDEIGELSVPAQAMLLRVLSEGEILPVGCTRTRRVDVRVVAATSRDLSSMIRDGQFRADLYYRLRYLHVQVPAVRERGDDWSLLVDHFLARLSNGTSPAKRFSSGSLAVLARHVWPGNVREIQGLVDTAYHLADDRMIEPVAFLDALETYSREQQLSGIEIESEAQHCFRLLQRGSAGFWELVHRRFLARELSRAEVREIVSLGLRESGGSYKRLLADFGIAPEDYLKLMDFLRHHDLKPDEFRRGDPLPRSILDDATRPRRNGHGVEA